MIRLKDLPALVRLAHGCLQLATVDVQLQSATENEA
jgi:hypothetical protein